MNVKIVVLFFVLAVICAVTGWWLMESIPSGTSEGSIQVQPAPDSGAPQINGEIRVDRDPGRGRVPAEASKEKERESRETSPVPAEENKTGTVVGCVVDRYGDPVIPAEIEVRGRRDYFSRKEWVDKGGKFRVAELPPGRYLVLVVEDSLPSGYAAPFFQTTRLRTKKPEGFMATEAVIPKEGGEVSVRLRVFLRAAVEGRVEDVDGKPLEGVMVRLQNVGRGLQWICFDAESDEEGYFCMKSVGPGKYKICTYTGWKDKKLYSLSRPIPYEMEIVEGRSLTLPPLVFGKGSVSLEGFVCDQYGKPFPGLNVIVYLDKGFRRSDWDDTIAYGKTDGKGRYEMGPFPARAVRVQIAPFGYIPGHDDENFLKHYVKTFALDLRGKTGLVRAPDAVAERSEPFEIRGELVSKSGEFPDDVRVEIVQQDGKTEELNLVGKRREGRFSFRWKVETPHPPVKLQVRDGESILYSEILVPKNETRSGLIFSVP